MVRVGPGVSEKAQAPGQPDYPGHQPVAGKEAAEEKAGIGLVGKVTEEFNHGEIQEEPVEALKLLEINPI